MHDKTTAAADSAAITAEPFERCLDAKLVMAVVATGIMSFSGVCVETAMNVTFPTLMEEFGVGTSTVQWMTTAYLLVLAAVIPTSSYLNRRFKTKHVFLVAICLYIVGILVGFTAQVFPALLVGRVIEGLGTGIALPLMFNIITEQAPQKSMGMMMGIGTLVTAMAPAVGPSVGGWLAETFSWRAIFAALLPFLFVSLVLGLLSIRQSHEVVRDKFDWRGWALIVCAFGSLVFASVEGGENGWTSPLTLGLLALFAIMLAAFVASCRARGRAGEVSLISLSVFANRGFTFSLLAIIALQFCVLGLSFLIPNYAQLVMGAGETEAGSILLPGCAVGAVMAPLAGRLLDRFGARKPILTGAVCILAALVLFWALSKALGTYVAMAIYVLFAFGQSVMVGNSLTNALSFLPAATKADGNAVVNTLQQLSGALGTSIASAVVAVSQAAMPNDMATATMLGTRSAYLLLIAVGVLPLVCSLVALASPKCVEGRDASEAKAAKAAEAPHVTRRNGPTAHATAK